MEKKNDAMICGASLSLVGYSKDKSPKTLAYRFLQPNDKFSDVLASLRELRESKKDSYDTIVLYLETVQVKVIDFAD